MKQKLHIILLLSAAFSLCYLPVFGENTVKPNLLIIMTDEHNFRTLGCYRKTLSEEQAYMWGKAVVETPHIDSIADAGAICTSFYAVTPVCAPSRAAFVSGRYPQNTPVVLNNIPMSDDIVTFAEVLRRHNYATGYIGKWHLDGLGKPQWAPERKFGFEDNRYMFNRGHWKQLEDGPDGPRVATSNDKGQPDYSIKGANEENFATDFLTNKTIDFINTHKSEPFCLMLSISDPHGPDTVRPPYDTMYEHQTYVAPRTQNKSYEGLPAWGAKEDGSYKMSQYYGMVKCIDDNVGKILAVLTENKLMDNTIIVFTSDHGDLKGEHHRHNKGPPYEASARVPFLISWPGTIKAGRVVNEALTSVDFQPTLLKLMNMESSGKEEGRDASSLFTSDKRQSEWEDIAFMRSTIRRIAEQQWLAVLTDRYKLVYSGESLPWLFDLEKDPDEIINFFKQEEYADTIRWLTEELLEYGKKYNDTFIDVPNIREGIEEGCRL